jgi:hypothetical protein
LIAEQELTDWRPEDLDDPLEELRRINEELTRQQYFHDPVLWDREKLRDQLWSAQEQILYATRNYRKIVVRSCHDVGKSFIVAVIAGHWVDTSRVGDAFVVTSAPSSAQVRSILWRELARVHTRGHLGGRMNQTEWLLPTAGGKEELVAFGRKPDDFNPAAFQGIHAPRVLVLFDEANGIRGMLWEAGDSLCANEDSLFVAIGNPDDPTGEFYEACKPGSGWYVIEIGAFDSPNFTGEPMPQNVLRQLIGRTYVEEKRRKWAPQWIWVDKTGEPTAPELGVRCVPPVGAKDTDTNPLWQSKILGRFPEHSDAGGLIPISWISAAQRRTLEPVGANELGLDVGGGGDASVIAHRIGPVVRIKSEDHNPDTMQTCGNLIAAIRETKATLAKVDEIGIGRGVTDRAKEQGQPVVGINVARSPVGNDYHETTELEEAFVNLRAQLWWGIRERFETGLIDIDSLDEDLAGELVEIRYKRTSSGKIQIESKDDAKRRGIPSPNRAEALMLAFAPSLEAAGMSDTTLDGF